jgi:hypothetical protein
MVRIPGLVDIPLCSDTCQGSLENTESEGVLCDGVQ